LDNETQIFKAITGKTRRGPLQERLIYVDAPKCSFKEAEGWKENTRGSGYIKDGDDNKVPENTASAAKKSRSSTDFMA